jgi:GNAT superfamily N-acetyltransferase
MREVADPAELAELFGRDREVHAYGLADLESPISERSRWFRRGDASVGIIDLGEGITTVYAVSAADPEGSLELTIDLLDRIVPGTMITGPHGLAAAVGPRRRVDDLGLHIKCVRRTSGDEPERGAVVSLSTVDFPRVAALHATAPGDAFVLESMLDDNTFVGLEDPDEPGRLIAAAGTHAVSERYAIAALGAVLVEPAHRGRGLGAVVTAGVCDRLEGRVSTVALNVEAENVSARRTYERLGFVDVLDYEEVIVDPQM